MTVTVTGWTGRGAPLCTVTGMGFNPFREQKHGIVDIALVVGALALTLALVAWGLFGG